MLFFYFKRKTAYEVRISDWSSDVCSSDLVACRAARSSTRDCSSPRAWPISTPTSPTDCSKAGSRSSTSAIRPTPFRNGGRSEEHTSALQSLMRISYAVVCLKKKQNNTILLQTLQITNSSATQQ